ncbi:MAG: S8 family serine peptidase [Oligoflexia bacterium]|nr:S8 family serine peptidase [Oligoflexia bacterium]
MKINKFVMLLSALFFAGAISAQATAPTVLVNGEYRPAYKEGEVIVKYRDSAVRSMRDVVELYQRISVLDVKKYSGNFSSFEHLIFNSNNLSVEQAVAELQRDPMVEYAQPNYMVYAFPNQMEKPKSLAEPCIIPGIPFPPGCEDSGSQPPPDDGGKTPCIIPGIPFPPGCEDSGDGGGPTPPPRGQRPAISPPPAEVNPPVNDPDLSKAWGIEKVSATKAWEKQKGSKNIIVAVIDTGIDYNHPDLAFNMWRNPNAGQGLATGVDPSGSDVTGDVVGWDFVHNDNLPYDDNQHGTHCAGSVGAVGGDGKGISGVSQRVSLMAVKFLSAQGSGDTAAAIKSIDYAVSRGAKVLSNSWGGKGDDGSNGALKESIDRAGQAGVLFVAAAGNDSTNNDRTPVFPAALDSDNILAVAATTETDGLAFFSNTGVKTVDVGAPGANVYSTTPGGKYGKLSGTSMACPHVAGAAALVWSQYPNADYKEIKRRLMDGGDAIGALSGKTVTGKRINVAKSLEESL